MRHQLFTKEYVSAKATTLQSSTTSLVQIASLELQMMVQEINSNVQRTMNTLMNCVLVSQKKNATLNARIQSIAIRCVVVNVLMKSI